MTDDDDPHIWDGGTCMICCLSVADVQTGVDQGVCVPRTRVTNIARHRYDVYIGRGRGGIWGNPFREGPHGTKSEVIEKYRAWIETQPHLMARLPELRGKILGCWCAPDICHGDVLAALADATGAPASQAQSVADAPAEGDVAASECQPSVLRLNPVNLDDYDTTVIILDVETTGVDTLKDQVIELAVQFGFGEDSRPGPCEVMRFKPTIPIPAAATAIHGIRDEDVAGMSSFGAAAAYIERIVEAATVIVGYNVEFDLKMLDAELRRVNRRLDLRGKTIVDPVHLWRACEPRTLQGAHIRFVGSTFEGAHSAAADVAATGRVLLGMLDHFGHAGKFWDEIAQVASPDRLMWLGFTNHFVWKGDRVVLNFGKHAGTDARAAAVKGYLTWMVKQDFPVHVIEIARAATNAKTDAEFLRFAAQAYPPPTLVEVTA